MNCTTRTLNFRMSENRRKLSGHLLNAKPHDAPFKAKFGQLAGNSIGYHTTLANFPFS